MRYQTALIPDVMYYISKLDAPQGFEPQLHVPKTRVLPLDEGASNLVGDQGIEPRCREATRLQRAAVANAAHHPYSIHPIG